MNLKGVMAKARSSMWNNEIASADLVVDLTVVALVVALLLIPLGLDTLVNMVLSSNYSAAQRMAIGAISTVIVIAVILSILKTVQKQKGR